MKRLFPVLLTAAALIWVCATYVGILSSLDPSASAASSPVTAISDDYSDLPAAVSQAVPAVVALQRITGTSNQTTQLGEVASGVIVSGNEVLTAGHSVMPSNQLQCSNTSVSALNAQGGAAASVDQVRTAAAVHNAQDAALVTIAPSENFSQLPHMKIAGKMPQTGGIVYFINYQTTADGTARTPNGRGDYAKPAIFSGVVIGKNSDGLVIATGAGSSYGHGVADTIVRRGASGGAIVNSKGQLVALSVSSQSLVADQTSNMVARKYGVRLPVGNYQIAYGQMLTGQLLAQLRGAQAACSL